mgnify:CR=1 FL=1
MLTDKQCKNASCDAGRPRVRLADSGGLYLEVSPSGSKRWFWKYRKAGKEGRLALGIYPAVTLKVAREGRDAARKVHSSGVDPVQSRQAEKLAKAATGATTYEKVAREFHALKSPGWSESHSAKWIRMNELYLFPHIGGLPIEAVRAPVLLTALRKVEAKGILSTAHIGRKSVIPAMHAARNGTPAAVASTAICMLSTMPTQSSSSFWREKSGGNMRPMKRAPLSSPVTNRAQENSSRPTA